MSRYHSYLASAIKVIESYIPGKPLSIHLKSFFASDKKYGSADRRIISSLCYIYFRTGKAFGKLTIEEKILFGLFLCEKKTDPLLRSSRPELDDMIEMPVTDKINFAEIKINDIFPFIDELSGYIDSDAYGLSFLKQPWLFLRIRPGQKPVVIEKLNKAGASFELLGDDAVKLLNSTSADKYLQLNKEAVVQDINSQKVFNLLENIPSLFAEQKITVWDCCAASGGKSILIYDRLKGNVTLTVSDIRESILVNLKSRLLQAGVPVSKSFAKDLSLNSVEGMREKFDVIICDAPCTGSGTWSRTPEQLYHFDNKMISDYSSRQRKIVSNSIPHLNKSGIYIYITCSVFEKENEEIVAFIQQNFQLSLLNMEYLEGYEKNADTMFVSIFST